MSAPFCLRLVFRQYSFQLPFIRLIPGVAAICTLAVNVLRASCVHWVALGTQLCVGGSVFFLLALSLRQALNSCCGVVAR
jgi:hypothetical protein